MDLRRLLCWGEAIPVMDVTIPSQMDALFVFAIIWSILPFAVGLGLVIHFLWKRRAFTGMTIAVLVFMLIFNEFLIKRIVNEARPSDSCVHSPGMPSSHATISIGVMTWYICNVLLAKNIAVKPRSLRILAALVAGIPIPISRTILRDHSPLQVTLGSVEGFVLGILWTCVFYFTIAPRMTKEKDKTGRGRRWLVNDYPLDYAQEFQTYNDSTAIRPLTSGGGISGSISSDDA